MIDHDGKRLVPIQGRIQSPHPGRPGVGAKEDFEKSRTVQSRQKRAISPPPLKRQCTTYDKFRSETHGPRSTSRKGHLPTSFSALRHSFSGDTGTTSAVRVKRKPEIIPVSKSFPVPCASRRHDSPNTYHTLGGRHVPRPKLPSKSASLSKPTCRICETSSATSFNPIVSCSGCSRSYHDSCRKPPLAPGINPQHWRCSSCVSNSETRATSRLSSALAPTSHSVVRDIFKSKYASPAPGVMLPDHILETDTDTHVKLEPAGLTTGASISVKFIKAKKAFGPPKRKQLECTEIPNTPSQHSSQTESSVAGKSSGNLHDTHVSQQYHHVSDDNEASAVGASTDLQNHTPSIILCSTCRKQTILAKPEEKSIQCSDCRTRTRVDETGRLEIHETPNVGSTHSVPPLPTSSAILKAPCSIPRLDDYMPVNIFSTQDLPMTEAKLDSTIAKASSLSWFNPERPKIIPKTRKVRDNELSCLPAADIQASDTFTGSNETFFRRSTPTEVDSTADISEQKAALEARQVLRENPICDNVAVLQVDTQRKNCSPLTETWNHDEPSKTPERHGTHSGSPGKSETLGESGPSKPANAVPEPIELGTDILPKQFSAERTTDRIFPISSAEEQVPTDLESKGTAVSMSPTTASTNTLEPSKRLNNRDLARIALVCAKGTGLTALQVIDWLASRFYHLQKGQGAWEKALKSVLSLLPEIRGVKTPRRPVLYRFASAALRAKNEKRYQSYLPPDSVPGPQEGGQNARKSVRQQHGADTIRQHEDVQGGPSTQIESSITKAIKNAASHKNVPTRCSLPSPTTLEQTPSQKPVSAPVPEPVDIDTLAANPDDEKIPSAPSNPSISGPNVQNAEPNKAKITSDDGAMFNPFERTTVPRPNITVSHGSEIKRKTSLRSVYPHTVAPKTETMTPEEKAAKIAEIKMRLKRKQFFGSAYRLAHVRRYKRQDIHDEGDRAWKPNSMTERPMVDQDSTMNDCDENRSLLEVFNLPSNAIPMNDGKELAFRDGTLINGRLPRSRQIYRVGKVLGSELTIG